MPTRPALPGKPAHFPSDWSDNPVCPTVTEHGGQRTEPGNGCDHLVSNHISSSFSERRISVTPLYFHILALKRSYTPAEYILKIRKFLEGIIMLSFE